jgi:hypothetical protein
MDYLFEPWVGLPPLGVSYHEVSMDTIVRLFGHQPKGRIEDQQPKEKNDPTRTRDALHVPQADR